MKHIPLSFALFLALPLGGILLAQSDLQSTDAQRKSEQEDEVKGDMFHGVQTSWVLTSIIRIPVGPFF